MTVQEINFFLALATLAMQIATVAFLALYFLEKRFPDLGDVAAFLGKWGLWFGFALSFGGIVLSLYYDSLGFPACFLCWWQRVFLYPQALLFAFAVWKKDTHIAGYSILLSTFGAAVALYQHYLQMGGTSLIPCPATVTEAIDCNVRFFFEFNYITFPLMSFSVFALLITLMLFVRKAALTRG